MIRTEYYKDLTKMNTFGMKVKARCFMEYDSVADLVDIEFAELARPILHIGGGSNLLFTDDFKGTVLHSGIDFIEILDEGEEVLVSVGAGVLFDDFCAWAAKEGLWGIENLSYIPGEVGASAVQNIGAYGVEVKDVIRTVCCYDTLEEEFVRFRVEDCGYGYRDSIFKRKEIKGRYIVTHVVFALSREPKPRLDYGHLKESVEDKSMTPELIRKTIIRIRKEKLPEPSVMGSAGSFFMNPVVTMEHFQKIEAAAKAEYGQDYNVPHYILSSDPSVISSDPSVISSDPSVISSDPSVISSEAEGRVEKSSVKIPAAWMIEQCGWKGKRSGGAAVYDKQPLVIVNFTGDAYPEEIIGLEKRIIASVKSRFGVELHPEVEHI